MFYGLDKSIVVAKIAQIFESRNFLDRLLFYNHYYVK